MGKRKKEKLGSGIGTKRMRLRSSGSLAESDLGAELRDHQKTDSSKTSDHRTMGESLHVGISYREAKRFHLWKYSFIPKQKYGTAFSPK